MQRVRIDYNKISSLLLIFVASIALWKTRGLSEMSYVFPRAIGAILLTLSIIYFVTSLLRKPDDSLFGTIDKIQVMMMSLSMIGYLFLIVTIGFLIASIIYTGATALYLQKNVQTKTSKQKLTHASIFALSISVVFYFLFKNVFLIQLPTGLF